MLYLTKVWVIKKCLKDSVWYLIFESLSGKNWNFKMRKKDRKKERKNWNLKSEKERKNRRKKVKKERITCCQWLCCRLFLLSVFRWHVFSKQKQKPFFISQDDERKRVKAVINISHQTGREREKIGKDNSFLSSKHFSNNFLYPSVQLKLASWKLFQAFLSFILSSELTICEMTCLYWLNMEIRK